VSVNKEGGVEVSLSFCFVVAVVVIYVSLSLAYGQIPSTKGNLMVVCYMSSCMTFFRNYNIVLHRPFYTPFKLIQT